MKLNERLEYIEAEHDRLADELAIIEKGMAPDEEIITEIKKKKLLLKDEAVILKEQLLG